MSAGHLSADHLSADHLGADRMSADHLGTDHLSGGQPYPGGVLAPWATGLLAREDRHVADVRVLVVDDQAPFRLAMAAVVEETDGFVVVGLAATGEEAVELAASLQPDLVLMDVNLPGIDGLEATRRVRTGHITGDHITGDHINGDHINGDQINGVQPPLVLLLSTYDEDAGEQFTAESGAIGYVTKSAFGPDRLTSAWLTAAR
jgi:CheY-like chemotaxis protein